MLRGGGCTADPEVRLVTSSRIKVLLDAKADGWIERRARVTRDTPTYRNL